MTTTKRAPARTATRTGRPSKAVTAALGADLPTTSLPIIRPAPVRPTLDQLAAEARGPVFRLLDAGRPTAAAELLATYAADADAALWAEVLDR
jgi:hypothetical protein